MKRVARIGDMGEDSKLVLIKEDDGDIIVQVMPKNHVIAPIGIQFCTFSGGGRSHRTLMALFDLIEAIEADNKEFPCHDGEPPEHGAT